MPERDYSHIVVSEADETRLADMKLAYVTAARERDALEDERDRLTAALQDAEGSHAEAVAEIARLRESAAHRHDAARKGCNA